MCSGCCRGWNVNLTEAEAAPFKGFDWRATRPRFAGLEPLEPLGEGRYRLAHIADSCIFLDDDNLCAIHKELGFDAKPRMCKQFPYHPVETPDGIVGSFDFACPTVVADEGAPIEEHETDFRGVVDRAIAERMQEEPSMAGRRASLREEHNLNARRGVPLSWADYVDIEGAQLEILNDSKQPLTQRMLRIDRLATDAHLNADPGEVAKWIGGLRTQRWSPLDAIAGPPAVAMRQRAVLAPVIAGVEGGWIVQEGGRSSARDRIGLALALVGSKKTVRLATADAELPLARMLHTRFDQDGELSGTFTRFLEAYIVRKSLVDGVSMYQGVRYLALFFGAIRWYAVARAVMAERESATEADLRYAIALMERCLSHAEGFRSPRLSSLINMLFDRVSPTQTLYPSPYPV
jgi:hypothetical protein